MMRSGSLPAASRSTSLTVSLRRRRLPAISICDTDVSSRSQSRRAFAASRPALTRYWPWCRFAKASPSSTFCCIFGPNPLSVIRRFSLQAYSSSPRVLIPRSSYSVLIRLAPRPGISNSANRVSGKRARSSSWYCSFPVLTSSVIFCSSASPTPFSSRSRFSLTSAAMSSLDCRICRATLV